jgi:hypothetical protein
MIFDYVLVLQFDYLLVPILDYVFENMNYSTFDYIVEHVICEILDDTHLDALV